MNRIELSLARQIAALDQALRQFRGRRINREDGKSLHRGQPPCGRDSVAARGLPKHGLRYEELKAVSSPPPPAGDLLVSGDQDVPARLCRQVTGYGRLQVDLGSHSGIIARFLAMLLDCRAPVMIGL